MASRPDNLASDMAMPRWFRRGLIAVATLLLCSCRASDQAGYGAAYGQAWYESEACESCEVEDCQACAPGRLVGPSDEYLCDGDDLGSEAGVEKDGTLVGIEQEDTIAHYTTRDGRLLTVPSTRTCIYAPRFGAVRQVVHPMGAERRVFVGAVGDALSLARSDETLIATTGLQNTSLHEGIGDLPPSVYRGRQQAGVSERLEAVALTQGLVGPYATLQLVHLGQCVMGEKAHIAEHSLAAITWTGDQQVQVVLEAQGASAIFSSLQPGLLYQTNEPNCPKLRLVKLASTDAAHPGDEVDFTLRYDNIGDAPITQVTILDNLTTRLVYVEDSAKSSRDAQFATADNEAGSLVLRWELDKPLPAGEGGVLTFRTRVR